MYCTRCGTRLDPAAPACVGCGAAMSAPGASGPSPAVKMWTYLIPSVLVSVFCCLPFGLAAVVFASRADTLIGVGDLPGATAASRSARMWMWISFGFGLILPVTYLVVMIVALVADSPK